MGNLQFVPWLLAVVTGAAFGWLGYRYRRSWAPWAIGGALCARVVSTIVIGLFRAAFIPLSVSADASMDFKAVLLSVLLIAALGALSTYRMWWRPPAPNSDNTAVPPEKTAAPAEKK